MEQTDKKVRPEQRAAEALIAQLEAGTIPWRKPWVSAGMPCNLLTKKEYRGLNIFILALSGYPSPYWGTFNQIKGLGGAVKKGEHGTWILYFNRYNKKTKDVDTGEETSQWRGFWKSYCVFNLTQCEPELAEKLGLNKPAGPVEDLPTAEAIWAHYPNRPAYRDADAAWYRPSEDLIGMPPRTAFKEQREFYSTLFHEMVHSTGHGSRLNRDEVVAGDGFGGQKYSAEELVAEFGSAMLCGVVGIQPQVVENQAAYIKHWLEKLKASDNKKMLMQAMSAAQKACDHIRAVKFQDEPEPLKEAQA